MAFEAPRIDEMFGGLPAEQRVDRFEAYKSALSQCHAKALSAASRGEVSFSREQGIVKTAGVRPEAAIEELRSEMTTKAMSAEQINDVQSALDRLADIQKDWTLTNPLTGNGGYSNYGLVPYDLDPALALLIPRSFILRNSISRIGGIGQAKEYRRILGVSGSNYGSAQNTATTSTFFTSASANNGPFGGTGSSLNLQRPPKISYTADRHVVGYVEQGVSDEVNMQAQFASQGYTDLRQLSHTALLWSHMIGEERNLLTGVGSGTGYIGAIAQPTSANVSVAGATGGSLAAATTYYYTFTFSSSAGESRAAAIANTTPGTSNGTLNFTFSSVPSNAIAINVYLGTVSGTWTQKVTTTTAAASITAVGSGSYTVSTSADNGSANAAGYDGMVATFTNSSLSGYTNALNTTLSTTEPGKEFQDAFASLYQSVIADPEAIITTGAVRRELAKTIQTQTGSTGYRLNLEAGADGVTIGSVVSAIANEYTGRMVDVIAHPYMPAGVALIWSKTLPFPDSGVSETTQVANVQDLMVLDWPVVQLSYDSSSYQYGTMIHRAPAWSGAITGIQ